MLLSRTAEDCFFPQFSFRKRKKKEEESVTVFIVKFLNRFPFFLYSPFHKHSQAMQLFSVNFPNNVIPLFCHKTFIYFTGFYCQSTGVQMHHEFVMGFIKSTKISSSLGCCFTVSFLVAYNSRMKKIQSTSCTKFSFFSFNALSSACNPHSLSIYFSLTIFFYRSISSYKKWKLPLPSNNVVFGSIFVIRIHTIEIRRVVWWKLREIFHGRN